MNSFKETNEHLRHASTCDTRKSGMAYSPRGPGSRSLGSSPREGTSNLVHGEARQARPITNVGRCARCDHRNGTTGTLSLDTCATHLHREKELDEETRPRTAHVV